MSAENFLDTNVHAFAFDGTAPAKRHRARELIGANDWVTSWQVVQEFANVALHRFVVPIRSADLADFLDVVLWPRCAVMPSLALHRSALEIHRQTQYRYFDSLIVASALSSGASILFSEDLQHGRSIGNLTIRNPFLD